MAKNSEKKKKVPYCIYSNIIRGVLPEVLASTLPLPYTPILSLVVTSQQCEFRLIMWFFAARDAMLGSVLKLPSSYFMVTILHSGCAANAVFRVIPADSE